MSVKLSLSWSDPQPVPLMSVWPYLDRDLVRAWIVKAGGDPDWSEYDFPDLPEKLRNQIKQDLWLHSSELYKLRKDQLTIEAAASSV